MDKNYWIERLKLEVHPEGGFYREVYRSADLVKTTPPKFNEQRPSSTSIYYLLSSETKAFCHKIKSDEAWYYHVGSPVTLFYIDQQSVFNVKVLGPGDGQDLFIVIPQNCWFGARVLEPDSFALVSCMVSPGFEFSDLEMADRNELIDTFPQHKESILKFTLMDNL